MPTACRRSWRLCFPRETDLKASSAGGAIVLTGMVSDAVKASQIMAMATAFAQRGAGDAAAPVADCGCDPSASCRQCQPVPVPPA